MRLWQVPVHLETDGTSQTCAGQANVVLSALNHVWRLSMYVAFGVHPIWPNKCSLPAGLHCAVWSPCVLVSWAFFVSKWPSVQTACIVCVTPAGLSHYLPSLCARFVMHERRLCQNPIQTRAGKYMHALYVAYRHTKYIYTHRWKSLAQSHIKEAWEGRKPPHSSEQQV